MRITDQKKYARVDLNRNDRVLLKQYGLQRNAKLRLGAERSE